MSVKRGNKERYRVIRVLVLVAAMVLSACATSKQTFDSQGRVAHTISCDGMVLSWADCLDKAGEICGRQGYDLLSVAGENFPMQTYMHSASGSASGSPYTGSANYRSWGFGSGLSAIYRSMQIRCK